MTTNALGQLLLQLYTTVSDTAVCEPAERAAEHDLAVVWPPRLKGRSARLPVRDARQARDLLFGPPCTPGAAWRSPAKTSCGLIAVDAAGAGHRRPRQAPR